MINYSEEHLNRAKKELIRQFDLLSCQEFGKLTINMNKQSRSIEIVPEPHIRIIEKVDAFDKE